MKNSTILRSSLLAAALGAALSASALQINLVSVGSQTSSNVFDEKVVSQIGGYGALTDLHYAAIGTATNALGGTFGGTGKYSGPGGSLAFGFILGQPVTVNGTLSYNGAWTATTGTGTYSTPVGSGTLALVFNGGGTTSMTSFAGNIQAVPEPASLAALGVGAMGLLRRRKKA